MGIKDGKRNSTCVTAIPTHTYSQGCIYVIRGVINMHQIMHMQALRPAVVAGGVFKIRTRPPRVTGLDSRRLDTLHATT